MYVCVRESYIQRDQRKRTESSRRESAQVNEIDALRLKCIQKQHHKKGEKLKERRQGQESRICVRIRIVS